MTTLPQSHGHDSPEERQAKVERLLQEAAVWEPITPPTDFVAQAMARHIKKPIPAERRGKGRHRAWWGFSTVGVVAASMLFTITGKMPVLETTPTPSVAIVEPPYTPETRAVRPSAPTKITGTTREAIKAPTSTPVSRPSIRHTVPTTARRTSASRQERAYRKPLRANATARQTAIPRSPAPEVKRLPAPEVQANDLPGDTTRATVTATPTSEVFTTEDGRIFVPMVLAHTSEDGSEVSYTPAVVEVAYRN